MGKIRSFLGIFVLLFSVVLATNSFADGYVCDDLKTYTSCNEGYFMNGTTCTKCGKYSSTKANNTSTSCTCNDGYTSDAAPAGSSNTTTTTADCLAVQTTITLDGNGATTAGTTAIYGRYGNAVLFLDSARSKAMVSGNNSLTPPSRAYKVTYNANGGTVSPTSATATYTFKGYYSSTTTNVGSQYITAAGAPTSDGNNRGAGLMTDSIWYAQWDSSSASVALPTPTKAGCKFNGWSTSSTATSGTTGSYTPTKDVTLYATWTCMDISAPAKSLTYNGSAQSCANVTVNSPSGTTVTYSTSSNGTYSGTAPTLTNVGSTTVYYMVALTNYTPATGSYTCTMNKASSTITVKEGTTTLATGSTLSMSYPTEKSLSITCSNGATPTASGDTAKYVTVSSSGNTVTLTPVAAGNGTVVSISCPATTNYLSASASYTVNVAKGSTTVTVKQQNVTIIEGGNVGMTYPVGTSVTATCSSGATPTVASADTNVVTATGNASITLTPQNAGNTTVTVTCPATDLYAKATRTFNAKVANATINATIAGNSKTYDGTALTCNGGITVSSPASGYTINYASGGVDHGETPPSRTNAGTTQVTYSISATNYTTKTGTFNCTVDPATITISGGGNKTLTYNGTTTDNGTAQSCANVTVSSPSGASVTYSASSGGTYSATAPTLTNVGSTTVYYMVEKDNYTTKTGSYTCTMNAKAMTVSASNKSKVYDGSPLTCSVSVSVPSRVVTIKYGTSANSYTLTSAPTQTNVGSQTVYYQVTGDNFTTKTGSFKCEVTKATMNASLAGNSKTYDGSELTCDGGTQTGVPNNSTITYSTTNGSGYSSTKPTVTNVADSKTIFYKITNNNYNDFTSSFKCTVNKAANTLTLSASSGNMAYSTTKTFTVSKNTSGGALSVTTSNSDVATASISGTTVTITSKAGYGSADITVTSAATDNYNSASAKYTITVDLGTITLNNQSAGTAGTTAIYQKYNTNVYLDSARSKAMTASANPITIPQKTQQLFQGYYSATSGGTQYIDANGYITSDGLTAGKALKANGTWYAQWVTPSCLATNGTATLSGVSGNKVVCSIKCNDGFSKNGKTDTTQSFDVTGTVNTASVSATCSERTYTVAYDCGDGTGTPPTQNTATYNSNYTPAANTCTRSGYNFAGWAVSGTSDTKTAGTAFKWTYTADKTFTAKWTSDSEKQINYVTDGGTINGSYTAACNVETATFTLPTNVTKPGYTFKGWYTAATGGTKVTSVVKGTCTSTLTFYAQWTTCNEVTAGACNCASTQYPLNGTCTNCTYSCSNVTGFTLGTYNVCNSESNTICYRNCTTNDVANSTSVSGTVTKGGTVSCKATACADDYYISGNGCQSCPDNASCGGEAEWKCKTGYKKTDDGKGCEPRTYTVTLNANGGAGGTASVTATFNSILPVAKMPTRTNHNFLGYYDTSAETGGNQYYDAAGEPVKVWDTADTGTLYARWSLGIFTCTAGQDADGNKCEAGSYCPGGNVSAGTENSTTSGCERTCPSDILRNGTVSSATGSTSISQCFTTRSNTATPNGTGKGDQRCEYGVNAAQTDNYAGACKVTINWCNAGMYRLSNDDTECIPTQPGEYSPTGYTTVYYCKDLAGADGTVTSASGSDEAENCYNTCSAISIDNGVRNPVNATESYNGTKIPACTYTTKCNKPGYETSGETCVPMVYEITLDHDGGTSSTNTIWLKYNTGWYSNSGATTKITSVTLPTKAGGYTCSGYLSSDGDVVVDESGNLTTNYKVLDANATITANWGQNASITCAAGTYYKGTGTTCTDCPAGSYCEGITTVQGIGSERGRATCSALNGTYTAATDASGAKLTVRIDSAAKSTSAAACFATNVAYSTTTATGSQTCYYKSGTYNDGCINKTVFTCIAGYYRAKTTDTDCSVVGKGYYSSSKDSLSRSMCPGFGTDKQVTTDSDKSADITACKRGNTAVKITHGYMRARCTHGSDVPSDLTDVSGYKDNCQLGVVVTCDGGYYDDGSYAGTGADPYCVEVGVNNYSPDQETCSGSAEIPLAENPGCSTKISACPAGSTTNGLTTASSSSQCDGACPEGMVCEEGKEAQSCSDLTGDEYPNSDVGTTDVSWCYKPCETACVEPSSCPENFLGCKYSTGEKVSGRWYYGSSSCTVKNASCSVDLNNGETYCNSGYYLSAETQNCSTTCSSLEPAGYYRYSISATFANGPKACYDQCTPTCNHAAAYVLDAETGEETGTFVNHCPEHATCTEGKVPTKGYRWYPQEVCTPTSFCSFTFVCDPGYVANTEDSVEYGYTKTLYTAPMTASDVATCTPGTYKVTLNNNGGIGGNGAVYQKYTVGWYSNEAASGAISTVTIPTRTGYTFKGYFDARTGGHPIIGTDGKLPVNTTFTAQSTLYAQWDKITYSITYNLNGGTNSVSNPATYTIEDTPLTLAKPTKTGYIFDAWTGDKVSNSQIASDTTGNITVTANWTPTTFTVHFDPTDATGVTIADVTCTYDMSCKAADAIIMDYKTFSVWNTKADGSGQSIAAGGNITNLVSDGGEITLYAIWDQNMVACEAGYYFNNGTRTECKLGQYCPGTGKINEGSTGCIETCPAGGATIKPGATAITQCRKTTVAGDIKFEYGTALWDCAYTSGTGDSAVYRTDCKAIALSCDAGYYYTGNGAIACTPVPDGYYSPAPEKADGAEYPETMKSHACPGETGADDGIGSVQPRAAMTNCYSACALTTSDITNSKTVTADEERMFSTTGGDYPACSYTITCNPGYTPQNGTDPKCIANKYTIVLDKNQGTGNVVDSVKCEFNSGKCDLPATSALTRAGYVPAGKWCTNADGTGTCYTAGASTDKNISATGENTKLYAAWDADVFKITLVASDATSNATQDPVYLKYTVGWYSDEAAKTPITSIETANLPSKPGYNFAGYKIGDVTIVDASGKLQTTAAVLTVTTKDTSANVVWAQGNTDCEAGYYYPGTGGSCVVCEANHYCPGGSFPTDAGLAGHEVCPDDGISAGGESATNVGVCYKQGLDYTSATGKASGTQTCNYNDTDKKYNYPCRDISVKSCVAGYYYVSGTDCTEVGENHYSGGGSLKREVCPENGTTGSLTTAAEVGECYKTVDYIATYGTGTQVCNYTSQNEDGSAKYSTGCRDKYITACQGGYYRENADAIDCVKVGYDAYSEGGSLEKIPCPDGGDTDNETSATSTMCYKSENPFTSEHGSGVRYCRYTPETGDYTVCGDRMFQNCSAGYYWAAYGDADCVPVDYGFFGPVADAGNEGHLTARQECATYNGQRGQTEDPTSADASACFMSDIPCEAGNGTGTKVCGYDTSAENYTADCTTCAVDSCATGYYLSNNQCIQCPEGSICDENTGKDTDGDGIPDSQPKVCADLFNGRYPNSDKGATSTDQCWGECGASGNVATMAGRDYAGENIADTCEIATCKPQYYLNSDATECILCPEGMICEPSSGEDLDGDGKPDNLPKTCIDLTNGTHPFAEPGSTKIEHCYITCEDYEIEYGMAIRDSDKAYYDNVCTYKGVSDTGNPCEIRTVNGVETCVETSCNPEYELINGRCMECNRENATAYKPNGNCLVAKCHTGYHPDGDQCADDVQECTAANAIAATRTWDTKTNAYGICVITECADGYHIASNACVPDVQSCDIEHGTGMREWDSRRGTWGDCIATSCDAGYTNDKYETDEPGKQCGRCRNAYGVLGEIAVSSYAQGCEIAACMYQGELYNLENNECVQICPLEPYRDPEGTGTMRWNSKTKKCERDCDEGYIPW